MSEPVDPYAAPPRDRETAGPSQDPPAQQSWGQARQPPPPWGQPPLPWGQPPARGPASGAGGLGIAALVLGLLSAVLGVTMIAGVVLGVPAVVLGLQGRALAARRGGGAGTAVAGVVLGLVGLVVAAGTYLYLRADLREYQGCRKESVSLAQDRACEDHLRRAVTGG